MTGTSRIPGSAKALLVATGLWFAPALSASAEGLLDDRMVMLRALVIPIEGDPPQVASLVIAMRGGPGVELPSMRSVRQANGDDPNGIVEVSVDVRPDDILIEFTGSVPTFYSDGYFVGYEFAIPDLPQAMIDGARLDPDQRLPGMRDADLQPIEGALRLHVGGKPADPGARLRILFPTPGEAGA